MICKTDELFLHCDLPSTIPPSANVLDDRRFDLALGQIKLGPPLGQSQFYYLSNFQCYTAYCCRATRASLSKALV
jgi:hypothetical protein